MLKEEHRIEALGRYDDKQGTRYPSDYISQPIMITLTSCSLLFVHPRTFKVMLLRKRAVFDYI